MNPQRRQGLKALAAWSLAGSGMSGCSPRADVWPQSLAGGWVGATLARGHAWRDGQLRPATGGAVRAVHVLVLGAGVGGLSAAHHLMRAGIDDLAVLDLDDQPGGNAQGHSVGGLPCPSGAHYLPMPGPQAEAVRTWLAELGVIRQAHGQWVADERHRCHDPQERLFVPADPSESPRRPDEPLAPTPGLWRTGHWHEGLWPDAERASAATRQAWRQLAGQITALRARGLFAMPTHAAGWGPEHAALDAQTFTHWLDAQGLNDPSLRWLMDYVCRDDYGASASRVSAWAGLHYFASRHGLRLPSAWGDAPDDDPAGDDAEPTLTWPEGNGWLTRQLAAPLQARWQPGQVAVAVHDGREAIEVDAVDARNGQTQRWRARHVVLALPLRVAHRLLDVRPAALTAVCPLIDSAPWLVSNLLLSAPLDARPGAPLSWDNVLYTSDGVAGLPPSLGYVNARHQSLAVPSGASLLTHYWALGGQTAAQGQAWRQRLHAAPWQDWARAVGHDLVRVHPDLPHKLVQVDLHRHGHAMVVPQPGLRGHAGLAALQRPQGLGGRLHFAHADLSAYSVFEEAFTHGARVAAQIRRVS